MRARTEDAVKANCVHEEGWNTDREGDCKAEGGEGERGESSRERRECAHAAAHYCRFAGAGERRRERGHEHERGSTREREAAGEREPSASSLVVLVEAPPLVLGHVEQRVRRALRDALAEGEGRHLWALPSRFIDHDECRSSLRSMMRPDI